MSSIRINTSIASACALLGVDTRLVSVRWNETSKQSKREAAVIIPMECVSAPEVPESFRALVESALFSQAESTLKTFATDNPNATEIDSELFDRPNLTADFLNRGSTWLSKKDLELQFTASATWKRIASRPEFSSNKTYQAVANRFKDAILKLSGKATFVEPEDADKILSKIEDSDLSTPFGEFVVSRLESMKNRKTEEIDFDSL